MADNTNNTNNQQPKAPTTYTRGSNIPTPSSVPQMPKVQPPKAPEKK